MRCLIWGSTLHERLRTGRASGNWGYAVTGISSSARRAAEYNFHAWFKPGPTMNSMRFCCLFHCLFSDFSCSSQYVLNHALSTFVFTPCISSAGATDFPTVRTGADSQWRWEEAVGKGGGDSAQPAAPHEGKLPPVTAPVSAAIPRIVEKNLFSISAKSGFWRKYAGRFAINSRLRRAERRRRSTLTAWRSGENLAWCENFDLNKDFLCFLSVRLYVFKDGGLQRTQPGAAEEGLQTGEMQHVRHFNFSNFQVLSQICRRCL